MNKSKQFRIRLALNIAGSSVFFILAIIFALFPYLGESSLLFLLIGVFAFFYSRQTKLTTDESGISYRIPFRGTINIRWEEIHTIKSPKLFGGLIVRWGEPEARFWTLKTANNLRMVNISREFDDFPELLRLVISKSVNASIDPRIHALLQIPNIQRARTIGRRFGIFFLCMSAAFILLLSEFASGRPGIGNSNFPILECLYYLMLVFGLLCVFFFATMSRCVILLLLLGFSIRFTGFKSAGFVEVGILVCAILAIKSGNRLLGITEILAAIYLGLAYGAGHYLY